MASRIKGITVEIGGDTTGLQSALKEAIGETSNKLEALKTAQEQAKAQLESGDLGQDKYDALQREIIETSHRYIDKLRNSSCKKLHFASLLKNLPSQSYCFLYNIDL